jgi:hypothetical protein
MTMPRLSLYRPEKGNDFRFIDKTVWEMFQVGGVDVLIHKYLGPVSNANPANISPTTPQYTEDDPFQIQDLLFLENRDRKYDPDVYLLRGVYNIQDIDFNLSQFGLFLQNDTVFMTFHINDTVEKLGRKIIAGDVIELPHLKDEYALNDLQFALKRFYVVEEVNRAAEGFSVTWYPHLYRAKCKPLVDSQEFKQILDKAAVDCDGNETNTTLRDIMSTYEKEMQITQAVLDQAEADAPRSGYDTTKFYTVPLDDQGKPKLVTVNSGELDASIATVEGAGGVVIQVVDTTSIMANPTKDGYDNYHEDIVPPNGAPFTSGIAFPLSPIDGQFCLRTDYFPKRLFRYNGRRWVKYEDGVRMTMSNLGASDTGPGQPFEGKDIRLNQKSTFINNDAVTTINGKEVKEKQSLTKALRPKADE